jgi:hypothetical protein
MHLSIISDVIYLILHNNVTYCRLFAETIQFMAPEDLGMHYSKSDGFFPCISLFGSFWRCPLLTFILANATQIDKMDYECYHLLTVGCEGIHVHF